VLWSFSALRSDDMNTIQHFGSVIKEIKMVAISRSVLAVVLMATSAGKSMIVVVETRFWWGD
jgi:hypothetical protein